MGPFWRKWGASPASGEGISSPGWVISLDGMETHHLSIWYHMGLLCGFGLLFPKLPCLPLDSLDSLGTAHASSDKKQKWSSQTACTGLMLYIGQQCKFADSSLIAIRSFLLHIQQFWQLLMLLTLHQV